MARASSLALVIVLLTGLSAFGFQADERAGQSLPSVVFLDDDPFVLPPPHVSRPLVVTSRPRRGASGIQPEEAGRWTIPPGAFGLTLSDGIRIIGRPAKGWGATVKTSFGTVTIPLSQIRSIAARKGGGVTITLINNDRVSGTLVAKSMRFVTPFGTLSVPTTDLVTMSAPGAPAKGFAVNVVGAWEAKVELDAAKMKRLGAPAESIAGMIADLVIRMEFKRNGAHVIQTRKKSGGVEHSQTGKWTIEKRNGKVLFVRFTEDGSSKPPKQMTLTFTTADAFGFDSSDPEFQQAPIKLPMRFKRVK